MTQPKKIAIGEIFNTIFHHTQKCTGVNTIALIFQTHIKKNKLTFFFKKFCRVYDLLEMFNILFIRN